MPEEVSLAIGEVSRRCVSSGVGRSTGRGPMLYDEDHETMRLECAAELTEENRALVGEPNESVQS